jgi:thiol:disulfide interchange protein
MRSYNGAMKDAYKPLVGIGAVLVGVVALVAASTLFRPKEVIPWRTDFAAAKNEAAQGGKPVFAYFTAEWCGPCQSLKSSTWASARVETALRSYVPVRIDIDQHPDLFKRYGLTPSNLDGGIPAFRVIDSKGELRKEATGYMGPDDFLKWLNR